MGEIIHEAKSDKWLIYKLHKELQNKTGSTGRNQCNTVKQLYFN